MLLKLEELYHYITLALSYVLTGYIFIARGKQNLQYDYSSRVVKKRGFCVDIAMIMISFSFLVKQKKSSTFLNNSGRAVYELKISLLFGCRSDIMRDTENFLRLDFRLAYFWSSDIYDLNWNDTFFLCFFLLFVCLFCFVDSPTTTCWENFAGVSCSIKKLWWSTTISSF